MIKKTYLLFAVLVFDCFIVAAQTTSLSGVKSQLDIMFSGLDKTKVPTGYLWDTAVNLIEAECFNGSILTDSNYVSLHVMGDMLSSINSASVGADTICVQSALSMIERNTSLYNVMVGFLFKPYNFIAGNALTDNLISYSNGIVGDRYINGVWQNPYEEDVLFGFATGNDGIVGRNVTFSISNIDSLSTQTFQSIQFDPGDGNGYRPIALNGSVHATYTADGYVEAKLALTYGGQTFESHCMLYVRGSSNPRRVSSHISSNYLHHNITGNYKAKVTYHISVSFNKQPIIVSEGFDPWKLQAPEDSTNCYSGFTDIIDIISNNHSAHSFFQNYDVFYIDWYDYGADVRANAEAFKEVIRWVNEYNQSGKPNIVLGQSMGGLIARYALRDMELDNELHNTTLFISHDVPYLGANVSPGLLYTYWDIYDIASSFSAVFSFFPKYRDRLFELLRLGTYTSVRQMLPLYMNASWNYDATLYDNLQSDLDLMGFPQGDPLKKMENVAIINGGKSPQGTLSLYNSGDTLLDIDCDFSAGIIPELMLFVFSLDKGNLLLIPGKNTLSFQHTVYPFLNNSSLVRETELVYKKKLLWLLPLTFNLFSKEHYSPSSGTPLDAISSSYYDVASIVKKDSIYYHSHSHSYLDSLWLGYYSAKITWADKLSFIPTASAMVMPDGLSRDYVANRPIPMVDTPFSSYIMSDTASFHTAFYPGTGEWLHKVVETSIVGPSIGLSGSNYSLTGGYASSFSMSTSNSGIASLDSLTNTLSVHQSGFVDIVAEDVVGNYAIKKKKRILAGMPQMVLDYSSVQNGYSITANYVSSSVEEFINSTGLKDSLQFKWQLNTGSMAQPVIDTSRTFIAVIDSLVTFATVTFSIIYRGQESAQSSVILRNPDEFSYNIRYIHRNNNVTAYYSTHHSPDYTYAPPFRIWVEGPLGYQMPSPFALWKIKALGKTFQGEINIIGNMPCVEFGLFYDDDVASLISSVTSSNRVETLIVYVCESDDTIKQVIQIPISWSDFILVL